MQLELEYLKPHIDNVILDKHKHPSEISLDSYNFDYTIRASNIEELIEQTKEIMIKEKVI